MRSLLVAAAALAGFALAPAGRGPKLVVRAEAPKVEGVADGTPGAPCPAGHFPDGEACVSFAEIEETSDAPVLPNAHHDKSGAWVAYDQIGRRPDRPEDYDAYRYPIPPGLPNGHSVISGYDLDRPDQAQRRGRTLRAVVSLSLSRRAYHVFQRAQEQLIFFRETDSDPQHAAFNVPDNDSLSQQRIKHRAPISPHIEIEKIRFTGQGVKPEPL